MQFQTEIMVNFISQKFHIISSKYIQLMQLTITQQSYSKNLSFNTKYYCNYNRNPGYIQITDTGKFLLIIMSGNYQGWATNSTPGIYQWHLPVFPGMANMFQVGNTGKYNVFAAKWQICILAVKCSRYL